MDKMSEKTELMPVLAMILNALDRDAVDGKTVRGEMAAELRKALDSQHDVSALVEGLELAANRLDRLALETKTIQWQLSVYDWAAEARATIATYRATAKDDTELNELRAERDTLRAELAALREQKPVAEVVWPNEPGRTGGFRKPHYDSPRLSMGTLLYAAPVSAPIPAAAEVAQVPREEVEQFIVDYHEAVYGAGSEGSDYDIAGVDLAKHFLSKFRSANEKTGKGRTVSPDEMRGAEKEQSK